MQQPKTVFEKLMAKELPCHVVYEDEHVFAFLDIEPLSVGHTLVIPRTAVARLGDLSDEQAAALGRVLPRLCRSVCSATGAKDYNVLQNNGALAHQAVPHVHFHIIPRQSAEEGLKLDWRPGKLDPNRGRDLAERISASLEP